MPEDYYLENVSSKFADDISEGKFSFPIVHAIAVMKNDEVYGKYVYLSLISTRPSPYHFHRNSPSETERRRHEEALCFHYEGNWNKGLL